MEDVRLGRESTWSLRVGIMSLTSQILVPYSDDRIALIIGCSANGSIWLSNKNDVAANNGMIMPFAGAPLVLDIQHHGAIVKGPWYCLGSAATDAIGWAEAFLAKR